MLKKEDLICCNYPVLRCRLQFADNNKRYAVVNHCTICGQNSQHFSGGNIGDGKNDHLKWTHEINTLFEGLCN